METKTKMWLPLESNPKVFTEFAEKLGFPTIIYSFHDVYAMDPEVWLTAIPSPVAAVILLYQIKKHHNDMIKSQLESQLKDLVKDTTTTAEVAKVN